MLRVQYTLIYFRIMFEERVIINNELNESEGVGGGGEGVKMGIIYFLKHI